MVETSTGVVGARAPPPRSSVTATVEPSGAGRVSLTTCLPPSGEQPGGLRASSPRSPRSRTPCRRCSVREAGDGQLVRRRCRSRPTARASARRAAAGQRRVEPDRERRSGRGRRDRARPRSSACGATRSRRRSTAPPRGRRRGSGRAARRAARRPSAASAQRADRLGQPGEVRAAALAPGEVRLEGAPLVVIQRVERVRGSQLVEILVRRHSWPFGGIRRRPGNRFGPIPEEDSGRCARSRTRSSAG